jgi:phosphoribosylamine--glycine ligase
MPLKLMVVGNGAREHTLVWKLAQSPKVEQIYVAPGNAGTQSIAHNLQIGPTKIEELAAAVQDRRIDLTIVGPEAPLSLGIVDLFLSRGLAIFGPTQAAAQIESSKVFAKELMQKYDIPCAKGAVFTSLSEALDYVRQQPAPLVVKADGLAAGKGVVIAETTEQAENALSEMMEHRVFGEAGNRVLVEECLRGREVSLIAFTDGETVVPMVPACDYKRIFDNDEGPNTGGMGSYSPPQFFGEEKIDLVKRSILEPAVRALAEEGTPYKGVLYAGLMLTDEGIKVLEFNARFGDPETQVILPRFKSDLLDIVLAVVNGTLHETNVEWDDEACVGVVLASAGYPGSYQKGLPITGWEDLDEDMVVFHAGTKMGADGPICTDGGRVLTVVGKGTTLADARSKVYSNVPRLRFDGCQYRTDIARQS